MDDQSAACKVSKNGSQPGFALFRFRIFSILIFLVIFAYPIFSQDLNDINSLIRHSSSLSPETLHWHNKESYRGEAMNPVLRWAFDLYQQRLTYQLYSRCIYRESCSEFARKAIGEGGIVAGFLLAMDRLGRCNGLEWISRARNLPEGSLIPDPPSAYLFRNE